MEKIPLCTCGGLGKRHERHCAVAVWCREGLPSAGVVPVNRSEGD